MTTPILDWCDEVSALWAALHPDERHTQPYRDLTDREVEAWSMLDRGFELRDPVRVGVVGETAGRTSALVEWQVTADLYVARRGRGRRAMRTALVGEQHKFARAVEQVTSWPAGVSEVLLVESDLDTDDDEGVVVNFTFTVRTEDS